MYITGATVLWKRIGFMAVWIFKLRLYFLPSPEEYYSLDNSWNIPSQPRVKAIIGILCWNFSFIFCRHCMYNFSMSWGELYLSFLEHRYSVCRSGFNNNKFSVRNFRKKKLENFIDLNFKFKLTITTFVIFPSELNV